MKYHTIEVSEERLERLRVLAARYGVPLEELVRVGIDELLGRLDSNFDEAIDFILKENDELYRRPHVDIVEGE